MTFEEFQLYFSKYGHPGNLPRHPMREVWRDLSVRMADHIAGRRNGIYLENFPREDDDTKQYRLKIWDATPKSLLLPAIDDLQRVFKSSKYTIHYENEQAKEVLTPLNVVQSLIDSISTRIAEPQSAKLWWPHPDDVAQANTQMVRFSLIDVSYKRIINVNDEMLIFFAEGIDCAKYNARHNYIFEFFDESAWRTTASGMKVRTVLHVVTKNAYINVDITAKGKYVVYQVYEHDTGSVPFVFNGGRMVKIICPETHKVFNVYESDFSGALPALNDLELYSEQNKAVQLTNAFPHRFLRGQTCKTCQGRGVCAPHAGHPEYDPDDFTKTVKCGDCHEGQKILMSPLVGYHLLPEGEGATEGERRAEGAIAPIQYGQTDVEMCKHVADLRANAMKEAQSALNIYRRTTHAQSALSKDEDKDGTKTQAERIGQDVFLRAQTLLQYGQSLMLGDNESKISITRSIDVKIDDETTLFEAFKMSVEHAPVGMRHASYIELVKRKFSSDTTTVRRETLAATYAMTMYLLSETERGALRASVPGMLREYMKAIYVNSLIATIENIETKEDAQVFAELDTLIDAILAAQDAQRVQLIE